MTERTFWITSFKSELDIANRLAAAGEKSRNAEEIITRLSALAAFLDRKGLSTHKLASSDDRVGEDFILKSSDLTPLGIELIKKAYVKWQRQAKSPSDVSPLEKAFKLVLKTD